MIMQLQDEVSDVTHVPDAWEKYWDDISAKELELELAHAVREEVRPMSECISFTGTKTS